MKSLSKIIVCGKQLENIELFIFDKDGTLIDVHHYWCAMIRLRAEYLVEKYVDANSEKARDELMDAMGIDLEKNRMKPEGPVGIKPRAFIIETAYKTLLKYSDMATENDVSNSFKLVDGLSIKKLSEMVEPLPGVPEFLITLKRNRIKMALATTDLTKRAELALSTIGIEKFFDFVAGADLVNNAKPAPDLVDFITSRLSVKNENSVVVGDSMVDLNMAKNSGSKFIGVKTGLYNDDFLKESDFLAETLKDIGVQQ